MSIAIHWFRQDLRLSDNPAFFKAVEAGEILPIYILDDDNAGEYKMGAASRLWLHHSLHSLNQSLKGKLWIAKGNPSSIIQELVKAHNVDAIYWNRCYEPWAITRDKAIKTTMTEQNIEVHSFNGSLLWDPWEILKDDQTAYKVFTPYYRKGCLHAPTPRTPIPAPKSIHFTKCKLPSLTIDDLTLTPDIGWDKPLMTHWNVGENGALKRLDDFIDTGLNGYKEKRNFPALPHISKLSPHIHFGEISPNQIWHSVLQHGKGEDKQHFCSELGWREFSYYLLYHFPALPKQNLQSKFDAFPWRQDSQALKSWKAGMTGYPFIDAGMRELWQTGFMHNRVRMVVGSFLVKNLLLHWHHGEAWFWDCLVDADLANNSASWQWVAGSGADAAPYFRIFNPITQGQKFDPEGEYTKQYVPELAQLPTKYLFCPWEAPNDMLEKAGVILGSTYPTPIVDIKISRERALSAYNKIKNNTT